MRDVAVIGTGLIKWGELWEKSLRSMFVEAALLGIDDSGIDHLDTMYVGCMSSGLFTGQEHLGALLADYLGVAPIPVTRVESACASGAVAFRQAFMAVASGMAEIALAGGVEKMTDVDGGEATYILGTASDQEYEAFHGLTFPGLYAMIARAHAKRYGTTRRQMAQVAVKNHANGSKNPLAQFPMAVTVEQVLSSVLVADPLRLLDCSPVTDGAAAVILCSLEKAKALGKHRPVKVIGTGQATDTLALHDREDLTFFSAVAKSAKDAYQMAGITPSKVQVAEVHDCFTIAEICAIEALGFVDRGEGGKATEAGMTALGGKVVVNPSGGLKAKGHPVGASGIAQIIEITEQLRGQAGPRQVPQARFGLAQSMGGTAASSVVHLLEAL